MDALPHAAVTAFLEAEHWPSAIAYLEHVIELGDTSPDLHDKLAELYLWRVRGPPSQPKKRKSKDIRDNREVEDDKGPAGEARRAKAMAKLLEFLTSSTEYRAYRILNTLDKTGMCKVQV